MKPAHLKTAALILVCSFIYGLLVLPQIGTLLKINTQVEAQKVK